MNKSINHLNIAASAPSNLQTFRCVRHWLTLLILCTLPALTAVAQGVTFPMREMSNKLYGSSLSGSSANIITVANDQRSNMLAYTSTFGNYVKYKANYTLVKLAIDHGATTVPTTPYIYKMAYKIEGAQSMSSSSYTFTANDTLVVAYDPDSLTAYQDMQIKVYPKLYDAKVTITGFYDMSTGTPVALTMPPPNKNFFIELSMQYQPYLKTHYLPGDMALNTSESYDATKQQLNVSWAPATTPAFLDKVTPAQYELEWTYSDNYAADGSALSSSAVTYNFKNNATRVITDSLSYGIPIVYPKGYIVYRVRMIRVDSVQYEYPIYGVWSLPNVSGSISSLSSSKYYQIATPHSGDSLNWNYTIHFAEGGKYKHVIGYFDGMLKNRQTITRFNSNPNQLLATENLYDYEGRPEITTLPTVINTNRFGYQPGVSISSVTGLPYAPVDFDTKPALCPDATIIPPFSNSSLANRYYSQLNTDTAGMQKYVPQAEGYPFVHTQLSTGFSDRVDRQGGAGTVLQVNKGHDTKNEYLQADQPDLNNNFGINAGLSSFYTKTVSTDPNFQSSMLVKDYKGKQIMTSLIGAAVDTSRIAIMFNDEIPMPGTFSENKLANPAENVTVGSSKIYGGSFYMDYNALSNIKYEYAFVPYTVCPSPYLGLAVKCSYDYDVHDACGVEKLHRSGTLGTTGVTTSSAPVPALSSDNVSLEKGKYTINKTMTIAESDIEAAVDSFMGYTPSCLKTENDFIREAVEADSYPCPAADPCGELKKRMMEELFTDHKYGKWVPGPSGAPANNGDADPSINSIYDIPQFIPGDKPRYRFQRLCVLDALKSLVITKGGKTYQFIARDTIAVTDTKASPTTYYVTTESGIGSLFKDEIYTGSDQYTIAEALLPLHPEYCKLLACFEDTLAERLKAFPDAATATKYGYFALDDIVAKDIQLHNKMIVAPFNMAHIDDSLRLIMHGSIRMDTFAAEMAFCLNDDAQVFGDAYNFFHTNIVNLDFPTTHVKDNYFDKLRTFYLSNRDKYVTMAKTGAGNNCLPCDSTARMKLIPDPLVPVVYSPDGSFNTGPDGFLALFSDTTLAKIKAFLDPTAAMPADTTGTAAYRDSASHIVYRADSTLSSIAADSIVSRLSNCFASGASTSRLHDSLIAFIKRGEVHNGQFFPYQVRAAITGAGLSLSDLCHPYLVSYDYYDESTTKGNCNSASFYNAVTDFFNTTAINNAVKTTGSTFASTTPSWPGSNFFATKIAAGITGGSGSIQMGTQYWASDSTYIFSFFKTGSDTVKVTFRAPNARRSGVTLPFLNVAASDSIIFQNTTCFFDDPTAYADGHIGRFMFRAYVRRSELLGGTRYTNSSQLLAWNNGKIMMNEDGSNQLASCVPATQFKDQFTAFADSMTAYGGFAQDHPLFYMSLRNFMNFNMKKVFSQDQYARFLSSCALADSMAIPMYGGYGRISFPTTSGTTYASFDAYKAALALSDGLSLVALLDYKNGSTESVIIDYSTIPYKQIRSFNDKLVASGGTLKTTPAGVVGVLYLPVGSTASAVVTGTAFTLSSGTPVMVRSSPYLPDLDSFTKYNVLATAPTFNQLSVGSYFIGQNMYTLGVNGYWVPNNYATVTPDYFKSKKQQLLQYAYSMQGMTPSKVLDTLQDYLVQQNVAAFGATQVSYTNPANPYRFTDLYYTDSLSRYAGYDTVKHVLALAQSYLGGSKIFMPLSSNKINVLGGTGSGTNLIMYRCGDGLYWYRYFGYGSKLFDIFIRVPEYIYQGLHPSFNLLRIIPSVGDTTSSNFTAMISIPGSNDTLYASGTTDFNIAWTQKLKDVLLGNETNFSSSSDAPASGEPGAQPNCEQKLLANDIYNGKINYFNYITKFRADLLAAFRDHVMNQAGEKLWIQYVDMRFGTTLYSYDRAGNLIQTVPPQGVVKIDTATAKIVDSLRANNLRVAAAIPKHLKSTRYEYNTANKPVKENTPDAGTKVMYYDQKGNVILSQTARQRPLGKFTYFLYDGQNRLNETGEVGWTADCSYFDPVPLYRHDQGYYWKTGQPSTCACENDVDSVWEYCGPFNTTYYDDATFNAQIRAKPRTQVVYTVYDAAFMDLSTKRGMSAQDNLRSRIAANMYYESCPPGMPALGYDHATHYSYDAQGNVKTLTQDFPQLDGMNQRYKRVDYEYDLLSGKVNMISYNRGYQDQLFQRYSYDADNRLTKAETSRDGFIWKRDAEYTYYQHGPLARVSIGDQRVQGMDYAYTLQGWLKSINGDLTDTLTDMGGDGRRSTITPKDAYATTIDYFSGDYKPIGNTPLSHLTPLGGGVGAPAAPLGTKSIYNGNIARQSTDVAPFGGLTTAYTYDQMNRIRFATYAQTKKDSVLAFNNWYASAYKYDMDGNIKALTRKEGSGITMDSMRYYYPDTAHNNKLANIMDYASFSNPGVQDITTYTTPTTSRVLYDDDGNVIKDLVNNADTMQWNIYGKATAIRTAHTGLQGAGANLYFGYDALGHRTYKKQVTTTDTGSVENSTFYVREASGNILAEYNATRELDKGGVIQVFPRIRGLLTTGTPAVLKTTWVSALSTLGYLTDPAFVTYITGAVGPSSTYATGYYLANDPVLTQQFIMGGYGTLNGMCAYSASEGIYPVADAMRGALAQQSFNNTISTTFSNLSTAIFGNPDPIMQQHAVLQVAEQLPDLSTDIAAQNMIVVNTPSDSVMLMNTMLNMALTNPTAYGTMLGNYYALNPSSIDNWLNAVTSDSLYIADPWCQMNGFGTMLQNALVSNGDQAAIDKAILNGTTKSEEGLYGFASWWPAGSSVLSTIASSNTLATVSFYSDPVAYLSGLTDYAAMDTALSLVPGVDVLSLSGVLGVDLLGSYTSATPLTLTGIAAPAVKQQQISLGNHHLYGSSRIGIDNYFPTQYHASWNFRTGVIDTFSLGMPAPWYSYSYNDIIDTNKREPYGNTLSHTAIAQHLLGQKQYELSNQLGNVQSTISDKRFVKTISGGVRDHFNASIVAAYDYYPYGMLMPGRFTQDTAQHCVTTTVTQLMPVSNTVTVNPANINLDAVAMSLGSTISGGGLFFGTSLSGQGGGITTDIPVTSGVDINVGVSLSYIRGSFVTIGLSEVDPATGKRVLLGSTNANIPTSYSFHITPKSTKVTLGISMMSSYITPATLFTVGYMGYDQITYEPQNVLVTLCNKGTDKYEFGFNGQMKMNEIAGTGNWNTAEFWEYPTRTATRTNKDPKVNYWESPYAVMGSNPIWHNDALGDTWTVGTDAKTEGDVKSIPNNPKNSKYVKIAEDGKVSLDFGDLNEKEITKKLDKDDGLALIKGLVDAKENYYYSTSANFNSEGLKETKADFIKAGGSDKIYEGVAAGYLKNSWEGLHPFQEKSVSSSVYYKNASRTTYGTDSKNRMVPTLLPQKGYDGQVGFAPGLEYIKTPTSVSTGITTMQTVTYEQIRYRAVRHELWENYYRTTEHKSYNDAHNAANNHSNGNIPENTFFMNIPFIKFPAK